jgi:hypothetical protein
MKLSPVLVFCFFMIVLVLGTGCTQPAGTSVPVTTPGSAAAPVSLSSLALTSAEAPENFTLVESRVKTSDEMGTLSKDLGWQSGYVVRFSSGQGTANQTDIVQTLVTYPPAAIPDIMRIAVSTNMAEKGLEISTLPSPGIGDSSVAFLGKPIPEQGVKADANPRNPFMEQTESGSAKQELAEIVFTKGSTMEVFRMTGPGTDYATLKALAKTAYAKLP